MYQSNFRRAFTLVEVMIATAIMAVSGIFILSLTWTGSMLFAKNVAVNEAHQKARLAMIRMESDIHKAVSVPRLIDTNLAAIASGSGAGIQFQAVAMGFYQIAPGTDLAVGQNSLSVVTNGWIPSVGMRLNIPSHTIEDYVSTVTVAGSNVTVTLENPITTPLTTTLNGIAVNITCFFTNRVSYVIQSGQLRRYQSRNDVNPAVIADGITSATPFSNGLLAGGTSDVRFVAAINLSIAESEYSMRGFKSANMFLNAQVPYRAQLTATQ